MRKTLKLALFGLNWGGIYCPTAHMSLRFYLPKRAGVKDLCPKFEDEDGGVAVGKPPGGGVLVGVGAGSAAQFSRKLAT